jgi:hypothetical protein
MALTNIKSDGPLHGGLELHWRMDDWIEPQQLLIRPFVGYRLFKKLDVSAGYTYINTHPYGDYPLPKVITEHNIWEQLLVKGEVGNIKLAHRYRLENRFIEDLPSLQENSTVSYRFVCRFRYRITGDYPLGDGWHVTVFDEIMFDMDGLLPNRYDRNWVFAAISYRPNEHSDIQLGYLHQWIQNNPVRFENHHGVLVNLFYDIEM